MADSATTMDLARRRQWKLWTLPVGAAIVAVILTAAIGYHPVAALLNIPQTFLAAVGATQERIHDAPGWLSTSLDWAAGPIVWLLLGLALVKFPPVGALIDAVFPDPPPFVFRDLTERRRLDMVLIDRAPPDFTGRDEELAKLLELLDPDDGSHAFAWRTVLGPTGIGKSRLAIEWLAAAQAKGWDVGIVDPKDRPLLAGWRPRRPTALVIDEARSRWSDDLAEALLALGARASARRPVRLLVLDQIAPFVQHREPEAQARLDAAEIAPAMAVAPLDDAAIAAIVGEGPARAGDAARIVAESAGRPRAAIVLAHFVDATSYADALRRWAELLIPELRDDSATPPVALAVPLICAALAGPIDADAVRPHAPGYDAGALLRFFDRETRASLERELPALVPDDLAQEIALRLLLKLDTPNRAALIDHLVTLAPARMEASLGAIWRDRPELDGAGADDATAAVLRAVQAAFDGAWPERAAALVRQAREIVRDVADDPARDLDVRADVLSSIARSRPFDPALRQTEAVCAVNAIGWYGGNWRWDDLERWGRRLTALAEDPRFAADPAIRSGEANGAANAMNRYGADRLWDDLERWGRRLIALAKHSRFAADPAIRLGEAKGAVNAVNTYGKNRRWDDLERWGGRLIALAEDPRFVGDPAIRLEEASAAANAINWYGEDRRWDDLERWGRRLIVLSEDPCFAADPAIRLHEARGSFNAISDYGKSRRWDRLERWGRRLNAVADDPRFAADPAIRLHEAMSAVNAINYYGKDERWDDLERWSGRLIALAEDPRFVADPAIRLHEAKSAANAINYYGMSKRWDDVERWGDRLIALADGSPFATDPAVRLHEAIGAANAIHRYGEAGLHGSGRHFSWKRRLAFVAQAFPGDPVIQHVAQDHDLTWVDQQRAGFHPYGRAPALPVTDPAAPATAAAGRSA